MKSYLKLIFLFLIANIGLAFASQLFLEDLDSIIAVLSDRPGMNENIYWHYKISKAEYLKIITIRLLFASPIFISGFWLIKNLKWNQYLLFLATIIVYIIAFLLIGSKFLIWYRLG